MKILMQKKIAQRHNCKWRSLWRTCRANL